MRIVANIRYPQPSVARPRLWRVLHEIEKPPEERFNPVNNPEVRSMYPRHFSNFGKEAQLLTMAVNPRISPLKLTVVYDESTIITNNQGFGLPDDPRANWFLNKDLDCDPPKVGALTCGGCVLTGFPTATNLIVTTLDYREIPTLEWFLQRPWFHTYMVTVDSHLKPRPFPQGIQPNGENVPIVHPLIADTKQYPVITIPLKWLEEWTQPELPNPFTVYRPYSS